MGISNVMSQQLEDIFNKWSKVKIKDSEVKKLIQLALAPNKETIQNLYLGNSENSVYFEKICDNAFEYAMSNESQALDTTRGTLFGAYNAVTGYFQNVRTYKNEEAKLKSLLFGGTGQLRTQKAFQLCESFAKAEIMEFYN